MRKEESFVREHITIITNILSNVPLNDEILERRINFILTGIKEDLLDVNAILKIEEEIKRKIDKSHRNKFSGIEIEQLIYKALGREREFDKSHLINLENNEVKSIRIYRSEDPTTLIFGDVKITPLGGITYTEWNGVEDLIGLSCYEIEKECGNGKTSKFRVFSNIILGNMYEDEDYRNAVLEDLLDELNMTKTNCNGYIGSIEKSKNVGKNADAIAVNEKYSLVYDSFDATLVARAKKQSIDKNKRQGIEER